MAGPAAAQAPAPRSLIVPLDARPARALTADVLREGRVRLDESLLNAGETSPTVRLGLRLFADVTYIATLTSSTRTATGRSWVGTLEDVANSSAAFARAGTAISGYISSPLGTFRLSSDPEGVPVLQELADDPRARPTPDDSVALRTPALADLRPAARGDVRPMTASLGSTLDLLVVYTSGAVTAAGSVDRLMADLEVAAALANSALRNAGTGGLRVVHAAEVAYQETALSADTLSHLYNRADGFLDDVHALRDRHSADVVTLITANVDPDICGRGYITVRSQGDTGLNVVEQGCLNGLTLAHEVGHNLGLTHDWYIESNPGYRPSAKGFVDVQGLFYTVMAYSDHCRAMGARCSRIAAFSNPLSFHRGQVTGVPIGTGVTCAAGDLNNTRCDADAVSTLALTFPIVADYRVSDTLATRQALSPGGSIRTTTGCALTYQADGNLVLHRNGAVTWQSRTGGTPAGRAEMQGDGNFVVYDAADGPRFFTATGGNPGAFLRLESDCTAAVVDATGAMRLWRSP